MSLGRCVADDNRWCESSARAAIHVCNIGMIRGVVNRQPQFVAQVGSAAALMSSSIGAIAPSRGNQPSRTQALAPPNTGPSPPDYRRLK